MKLGLIADIHGNLHALDAVLDQLDAAGVDMILCAGDLVAYGAFPNEVVRRIQEKGIPCVMGNYDDAVAWDRASASSKPSSPFTEPLKQAALHWTQEHTDFHSREYLKTLPWTSRFCIDNLNLILLHAGTQSLVDWVVPEQPETLEALAQELQTDVVVLGHTHRAYSMEVNNTLFINPGAVGRSLDGDIEASFALFDTTTQQVELRRIAYDIDAAVDAIEQSSMPKEIAMLIKHGARRIEDFQPNEMVLDVNDYAKSFMIHHLERSIPVFEELTFQLNRGQFLLVRGPNGVGKSTLLRCLFRSYLPSHGQAIYYSNRGPVDLARAADIDISYLRRQEIGFVTQFLRPRPRVTALELVAEPLLGSGISFDKAKSQAASMLDRFGFKEALWSAYPSTFSGGEQQKVNLARALITPRRLLLLDEPTASLDHNARSALAVRLQELKDHGVAMIGVLHHPEDVEGLIDDYLDLTLPKALQENQSYSDELNYVVE